MMVLLPGCGCCGSCVDTFFTLRTASSIQVTVSSSDYLRKMRGTYTGCPQDQYGYDDFCGQAKNSTFGTTQFFPGDSFAGTFALSKISAGSWQYSYPTAFPICNPSYLFAEMYQPSAGVYFFRLGLVAYSFSYCIMDAESYISKAGFDCNSQSYLCAGSSLIRPPGRYFTQNISRSRHSAGVEFNAYCENSAFPIPQTIGPMQASAVNPCGVSDPKCGPSMTFETVDATGSLSVVFSDLSFVP